MDDGVEAGVLTVAIKRATATVEPSKTAQRKNRSG
jgi:hypothetical protein